MISIILLALFLLLHITVTSHPKVSSRDEHLVLMESRTMRRRHSGLFFGSLGWKDSEKAGAEPCGGPFCHICELGGLRGWSLLTSTPATPCNWGFHSQGLGSEEDLLQGECCTSSTLREPGGGRMAFCDAASEVTRVSLLH